MKKNCLVFAVLALVAAAVAFTSCKNDTGAGSPDPKTAMVELAVPVELGGNPTTGYIWVYSMTPEGIVIETKHEYISDSATPGSGGKFIFTFKSVAEGEAELLFSYCRPWEGNALQTKTYTAVVDNTLGLTITE